MGKCRDKPENTMAARVHVSLPDGMGHPQEKLAPSATAAEAPAPGSGGAKGEEPEKAEVARGLAVP